MVHATPPVVAVIGGSGLYDIEGLEDREWLDIETPFGPMSDQVLSGVLGGQKVLFLPRHGRGHHRLPSGVNYRANIDGLKRAGATEIIAISACGSFREDLPPGHFVIVDQFIDRTFAREKTFFGNGLVGHVAFGRPVCSRLGDVLMAEAEALGLPVTRGGTYLTMEGPQFSTLAESHLYRSWNCSVIGMTNMPEAKLAREAELCYGSVAMVTDYDCWHEGHDDVTVDGILEVMRGNAEKARKLVQAAVPKLLGRAELCAQGCHTALDTAIMTAPDQRDPEMVKRLSAVAGRVL
ncbi:MAG: S-methyl-5'-thioadenosine phosphorylase [Rhodospirillales bacterium]